MNYKTLTLTLLLGLPFYHRPAGRGDDEPRRHDMSQMGRWARWRHGWYGGEGDDQGVISRIDTQNGKVGIKHEAIANLKMPP